MKIVFIILILLASVYDLSCQTKYQIGVHVEPFNSYSKIESRQLGFDNYVQIRNQSEPFRRGFINSFLIERFLSENFGLASGLRITSVTIGFNRQDVQGELATNNLERQNYSHRMDYFFLEVPLELKYKIFNYEFDQSRLNGVFRTFFINLQTGLAVSYQLQADHIRNYNLQSGRSEVTINEFESQLGRNQFNLATQVRIGFNFKVFDKWIFSIQPSLNYYTFSTFQNGFKDNLFFYSTRFGVSYML